MDHEIFYLCGWLTEMDAKIPDGKLTWTKAVQQVVSGMYGIVSTPEEMVEAMAVGAELNRCRERAAQKVKPIVEPE